MILAAAQAAAAQAGATQAATPGARKAGARAGHRTVRALAWAAVATHSESQRDAASDCPSSPLPCPCPGLRDRLACAPQPLLR